MKVNNSIFKRNIFLLYLNSLLKGLEFYIPIYALYLQVELFSTLNVTLILAINAIAVILLEVPTGAVADIIGRKTSLIASSVSSTIFLVLLSIGNSFLTFALAVIFQALGYTLASGTSTSLLYESIQMIEEENRPSFKRSIGIFHSLWPIGASVSSFFGGFLAIISMKLPIIVTIFPYFLALCTLFLIVDPTLLKKQLQIESKDEERINKAERSITGQILTSIGIIRHNRQLLIIFSVGVFSYAFGEVMHKLKPVFFEFKDIPIELFGLFYALTFGMSFLGSIASEPISRRFGNKRSLIITAFIPIPMEIVAVLTTGITAGVFATLGSLTWGIKWPILSDLINKEIDSGNRATILSITAMFNNLGFVLSSPMIGYLVDLHDINTIYLFGALMGIVMLVPYFLLKETSKNEYFIQDNSN
jgi:MFS family permease